MWIKRLILSLVLVSCVTQDLPELIETEVEDGETISLSLSSFSGNFSEILIEEMKIVPALASVTIRATDVPSTAKFILFQVHSFLYNASLSYNKTIIVPNFHVNGTNIGLVSKTDKGAIPQVYLKNFNINKDIKILIVAQAYREKDPIPGGCNMEFSTEIAPYMEVRFDSSLIRLKSELAMPSDTMSCAYASDSTYLNYDFYHLYLTERDFESPAYFDGIRSMLTVDRIRTNGRKVSIPLDRPINQRIFSSYPGTGSVFAVIVTSKIIYPASVASSAYVPATTYACSTILWADTCEVLTSTFSKLLCAMVFFLGLFVCFAGHRFFRAEMFIFGFLTGGLISYILVAMPGNFDYGAHLMISVLMGLIFGGFWLSLWAFYGIPVLSTVLVSLSLGYLIAAIASFAGTGDLQMFQNDINYWTAFVCVVVTVPILLVCAAHIANIVACCILGSYAVITPIDHYIGANLKYIIINTIRRATNKDFRTAVIDPPYQVRDLSLTVAWGLIAVSGLLVQLYLQRNKPPFPPPPSGVLLDRQDFLTHEQRPLLGGVQHSYATMGDGNSSPIPSTSAVQPPSAPLQL